jgi:hypothetical protein
MQKTQATRQIKPGAMAQVVERLSSKLEILGSNSTTGKKKKKNPNSDFYLLKKKNLEWNSGKSELIKIKTQIFKSFS